MITSIGQVKVRSASIFGANHASQGSLNECQGSHKYQAEKYFSRLGVDEVTRQGLNEADE
jgi:hypothetical protein